MIRKKVKKEASTYDKQGNLVPCEYEDEEIVVESVGDLMDILKDCSRGASLFMLPPNKGDNIQQIQVLDLRRASEFRECKNPELCNAISTYRAFFFTIGEHGPFSFKGCYEKQVEREKAEGGRRLAGLTWEDMKAIDHICHDVAFDDIDRQDSIFYNEVLKRFNEQRDESSS